MRSYVTTVRFPHANFSIPLLGSNVEFNLCVFLKSQQSKVDFPNETSRLRHETKIGVQASGRTKRWAGPLELRPARL